MNSVGIKLPLKCSDPQLLETEGNIGPSRQENGCFLAFLKSEGGVSGTNSGGNYRELLVPGDDIAL